MLWVCRMTSLSVKNVGQVINGKCRLESSWKAAGTFSWSSDSGQYNKLAQMGIKEGITGTARQSLRPDPPDYYK